MINHSSKMSIEDGGISPKNIGNNNKMDTDGF